MAPKLNPEIVSASSVAERRSLRDSDSSGSLTTRERSSVSTVQDPEIAELRGILKTTVSLVIYLAKQSGSSAGLPTTQTLVEKVCALEVARPIAVREGILQILVGWLDSANDNTSTTAMRHLLSTKDQYMAGWIHAEMVNQGAVAALAELAAHSSRPDINLDVAQILASLCTAPYTRAAAVESNCIGFLISFLYDHLESVSDKTEETISSVVSGLAQLAAGAISGESTQSLEVVDFMSPETTDTIVE